MSTIPLAKPYTPEKLSFPVLVQRKYDGVPAVFNIENGQVQSVLSRQGKPIVSVDHVARDIQSNLNGLSSLTGKLVGELVHLTETDFKTVSGLVRRQEPCHKLVLMVFDFWHEQMNPGLGYENRMQEAWMYFPFIDWSYGSVRWIRTTKCYSQSDMDFMIRSGVYSDWEGLIARSSDCLWSPGVRMWGYQKILKEPTIDLRIIGVVEAIDKYGSPKGMAGGLIADYQDEPIGIGPGRLTHAERYELWDDWLAGDFKPRVAKIKYKDDPSYDALRQPTFQHWHDKQETDA